MTPLFFIIIAGCCFMRPANGSSVQSPNFPNNYPNYQDKTYNLAVGAGQTIEITFETFDLEAHHACGWDWLKIVDKGQGSTLLDKACGTNVPGQIISKSNNVDVIFHSDYSVTRKGFKLQWKASAISSEDEYTCHTPPYNPKSVRGAQKDGITLWDGGLVPYETTSTLQGLDVETFNKAIKEIQKGTCIKFFPRTVEPAYIKVNRGCDCKKGTCTGGGRVWGGLGKRTPSNLEINSRSCLNPDIREDVALVIHEILHSLGVVHTQTRPDRKKYIEVLDENIIDNKESQYTLCPSCLTYNTPYNCMSVMHYKNYFFQKPGAGPTMKAAKYNYKCDLRKYPTELADSDIMLLNRMYECKITLVTRGYRYNYYPLSAKVYNILYNGEKHFIFEAKAKYDVHVGLDSDTNDSDLYEIVIGGWGNKLSMVRRGKQGVCLSSGTVDMGNSPGQKGWTETPGIVSPSEFRGFWVAYYRFPAASLYIKVGKVGESEPFMTGIDYFMDRTPLDIEYVGLSAYTDEATYIFPYAT